MKFKLSLLLSFLILTCSTYWNIKDLNFATVDDEWMLLNVSLIQTSDLDSNLVKDILFQVNSLQYSPINTFYYYIIYQINGYDPFYYHLGSLSLHLINTILMFCLLRKVFKALAYKNGFIVTYCTCMVWAVLPLNVESVVWISASKILLFSLFGISSFITFIISVTTRKTSWYILSLLLFLLAFLSKEQAVLLSLCFAIFLFLYEPGVSPSERFKKKILLLLPYFMLSLFFGVITVYISVYGGGVHPVDRYPFSQRVILSFYCLSFYIFNCIAPSGLHYHYPFPMHLGADVPALYYIYPIVITSISSLGIILMKKSKIFKIYLFGAGLFLFNLLLSIQIFPLARAAIIADRYMYLSSVGILIIFFAAVDEIWKIDYSKWNKRNIIFVSCLIIYVVILAAYSSNLVNNWYKMQLTYNSYKLD